MQTLHLITSEEKDELQMLVDIIFDAETEGYFGSIKQIHIRNACLEGRVKGIRDRVKNIAHILGLEVNDD